MFIKQQQKRLFFNEAPLGKDSGTSLFSFRLTNENGKFY